MAQHSYEEFVLKVNEVITLRLEH